MICLVWLGPNCIMHFWFIRYARNLCNKRMSILPFVIKCQVCSTLGIHSNNVISKYLYEITKLINIKSLMCAR